MRSTREAAMAVQATETRLVLNPSWTGLFRFTTGNTQDMAWKITYVILQALDMGLTLLAMALGAHELNPLMRAALSSPLQLTVIKAGIPLMLAWLVPGRFLIPAVAFLLFVLGWNIKELVLYFT